MMAVLASHPGRRIPEPNPGRRVIVDHRRRFQRDAKLRLQSDHALPRSATTIGRGREVHIWTNAPGAVAETPHSVKHEGRPGAGPSCVHGCAGLRGAGLYVREGCDPPASQRPAGGEDQKRTPTSAANEFCFRSMTSWKSLLIERSPFE